ncbi:helix-turn-helix domain containing protein [Enterobacter cloacae]|uniref:helix-turn-helix domain-containing protein n=1 Tax=Enterobacter cloacae TaxID=550 RepID=UPI0020057562|nr:helix-turn-helix domain-containing protein [Enterobacter cloacae]MCK6801993.1 helix-turn-helix domain containing protein [Enterobacter cloacae]MCK6987191.1 helix-turn-helix domain containing protein [Enterobacter cloacae]HDC4382512.1 helix-turn-helix domain-containing protein [Enterobacter cloacae]HDC4515693.1 helix-turn-helix domain-containing protein [Enterobacter cloacae]
MKKKTYDTPLAARLEELMQRNHLSGADMARIAEVSRSSVNGWFKRGTISKDSAAKLAAATGESLVWILTGAEDSENKVSNDEQELLNVYRELPPVEQRNMLAAFQMRLKQLQDFFAEHVDPTTRKK